MVLQKRSEYGFSGYQIPAMPRGCRSVRKKRSIRKSSVDASQMCAIELLATVAGKLLMERENPPAKISANSEDPKSPAEKGVAKKERPDMGKSIKTEPCDQGSCDEGALAGDLRGERIQQKPALKECSQASSCGVFGGPSYFTERTDGSQKTGHGKESEAFLDAKVKGGIKRNGTGCLAAGIGMFSEDHMDLDTKPPPLASSGSSVEVPPVRRRIARCSSLPKFQDHMEPMDRDDDENSSGCTRPYSLSSKTSKPQRIGDRRIRRLLSSKFWKVGPTLLKDGEFFDRDSESKSMFRSRMMCHTRQRTERSSFKRRKLFERSSISTPGGRIAGDATARPVGKGIKAEPSGVAGNIHGGNGTSSSITSQKSSFKSDEYKVKLRIKSFKVPELFIEIPENATVGLLKRTVLETVTAMLGNGLRVGVILQGKKVRDDNKTLLQAGITRAEKLDSLGFSLEPSPLQAPLQLPVHEDPPLLQPCDSEPEPLARLPALPTSDLLVPSANPDVQVQSGSSSGCHAESDLATADPTPCSKALVPVPSREDALAVVHVNGKSRRSEMAQRRIRRPFSVAEVEALVQAVEKLGTGRWRDVKLRAFDNAKHRTYVDLKDKWKTLVHTARISPQQRRGEPVPQELLDRVLDAHAYWSQHQSKLHAKQQQQQPEQLLLQA